MTRIVARGATTSSPAATARTCFVARAVTTTSSVAPETTPCTEGQAVTTCSERPAPIAWPAALVATRFFGGDGNDRIAAEDGGFDDVYCGDGYDVAYVDETGWWDDPDVLDPWDDPYDFLGDCEEIYLGGLWYDREQAIADYECEWNDICDSSTRSL